MADGFQLELDDRLAERLARAASLAGMSRADFTRHLLEQQLFSPADFVWSQPYEAATAEGVADDAADWDEVEPKLRARLRQALDARR